MCPICLHTLHSCYKFKFVLDIAAAGGKLIGSTGGISKGASTETWKGTSNTTSIGSTGGHQMKTLINF